MTIICHVGVRQRGVCMRATPAPEERRGLTLDARRSEKGSLARGRFSRTRDHPSPFSPLISHFVAAPRGLKPLALPISFGVGLPHGHLDALDHHHDVIPSTPDGLPTG